MPKYSMIVPVRVSHDRDKDRIYLMNADQERFPQLSGLHITLNPETHSERAVRQLLRDEGIIRDFSPGFTLADLVADGAISGRDLLMAEMLVATRKRVLVVGSDAHAVGLMSAALANQVSSKPVVEDVVGPAGADAPELLVSTEGSLLRWSLATVEVFQRELARLADFPLPHVLALDLTSVFAADGLDRQAQLLPLLTAARPGLEFVVGRAVTGVTHFKRGAVAAPGIARSMNSMYGGLFDAGVVVRSDTSREHGFVVDLVDLLVD